MTETVHPHECGEHVVVDNKTETETGSSPRMWGTQADRALSGPMHRFIPTHVGNTLRPRFL